MSDPISRDPEDINYNLPEENPDEAEDVADKIEKDGEMELDAHPLGLSVDPVGTNAHDDE